jgi:hypothetical protein
VRGVTRSYLPLTEAHYDSSALRAFKYFVETILNTRLDFLRWPHIDDEYVIVAPGVNDRQERGAPRPSSGH